jgi:hypothetical protein
MQLILDQPSEGAPGPVEAEPHLAARALHGRAQSAQLFLGHDVRFLDVDGLAFLERSHGVIGVRVVVGRDEDQIDGGVVEELIGIGGVVVERVALVEGGCAVDVVVQNAPDDLAMVLVHEIADDAESEDSAADDADMLVARGGGADRRGASGMSASCCTGRG